MIFFEWREFSSKGWLPVPIYKNFNDRKIKGSWAVAPARILGMSWENYLRFCRQHGATLYGKGNKYVTPCFQVKNNEFMKILNARATEIDAKIGIKNLKF